MIKLIVFLIKLLLTIIFILSIGFFSVTLSLILWDTRFIENVSVIQDYIWNDESKIVKKYKAKLSKLEKDYGNEDMSNEAMIDTKARMDCVQKIIADITNN